MVRTNAGEVYTSLLRSKRSSNRKGSVQHSALGFDNDVFRNRSSTIHEKKGIKRMTTIDFPNNSKKD
jgi:hypothetical protein